MNKQNKSKKYEEVVTVTSLHFYPTYDLILKSNGSKYLLYYVI